MPTSSAGGIGVQITARGSAGDEFPGNCNWLAFGPPAAVIEKINTFAEEPLSLGETGTVQVSYRLPRVDCHIVVVVAIPALHDHL